MKATYYKITKSGTEEIVLEGIVRDSEDTIYPGLESNELCLPKKCVLHNFKVQGYDIEYFDFNISSSYAYQNWIAKTLCIERG